MMTHEEHARGTFARDGAAHIEHIDSRLLTGEPTYLFNIYGAQHDINLGTWGSYSIPACPEGKEWMRAPQVIPGTLEELYPHFTDREEYRAKAIPGDDVVKALLGVGSGMDIQRYGVFASHNFKPSKEELSTAKSILVKELQKQIREADQFAASAKPEERESLNNDKYYRAARYLNVKKSWMSEAQEMSLCPFCSIPVRPTASKCSGCNEVINHTLYEAQKAQLAGGK